MEDVDVAGKLVLLAVGSLCLDDVIEYAGFDEFAVVASVPSLGGSQPPEASPATKRAYTVPYSVKVRGAEVELTLMSMFSNWGSVENCHSV